MRFIILCLALMAFLNGCAPNPVGFRREQIQTDRFLLTAYTKITDNSQPFDIYIEGDGLAWRSRTQPSLNPTPRNPLALALAARDPAANIIYIARPCQFTPMDEDQHCNPSYWTSRRFSEEVIASVNQAVDTLTGAATKNRRLNLIGYSGGGAVAVLVAARRHDVASIRTVAGNLDHDEVNRIHNVTPLYGSLNAIDQAAKVAAIPQLHFIGLKDDIVPPDIAARFRIASGPTRCVKLQTIANATHDSGWTELWPELLKEPMNCED